MNRKAAQQIADANEHRGQRNQADMLRIFITLALMALGGVLAYAASLVF